MQKHLAELSDMLEKVNAPVQPTKPEIRHMARALGLQQMTSYVNIEMTMLWQRITQVLLQKIESLQKRTSNLDSPTASCNCAEDIAVPHILQNVLKLGRLPKEFKNPKTEKEDDEHHLARQVRRRNLREQAQNMFKKLKKSERRRGPSRRLNLKRIPLDSLQRFLASLPPQY